MATCLALDPASWDGAGSAAFPPRQWQGAETQKCLSCAKVNSGWHGPQGCCCLGPGRGVPCGLITFPIFRQVSEPSLASAILWLKLSWPEPSACVLQKTGVESSPCHLRSGPWGHTTPSPAFLVLRFPTAASAPGLQLSAGSPRSLLPGGVAGGREEGGAWSGRAVHMLVWTSRTGLGQGRRRREGHAGAQPA